MRVFPDATFLIAAGLRPEGDYGRVLDAGTDTYVTSEHVLAEVVRNLERLGTDPSRFVERLRSSFGVTDRFDLLPAGTPVQDSGDRQALAEAIGAHCEAFVTSDTDFASLFGQTAKGVLVMKSAIYVRRILM